MPLTSNTDTSSVPLKHSRGFWTASLSSVILGQGMTFASPLALPGRVQTMAREPCLADLAGVEP